MNANRRFGRCSPACKKLGEKGISEVASRVVGLSDHSYDRPRSTSLTIQDPAVPASTLNVCEIANILINNNAIELFSVIGSNEVGFDSVIVTGAPTYRSISPVQLNNTATLVPGSEGLLEEVFGLPAGNGFILVNGIPQP